MKKLAWAARGLATVSGALLVGALVAVPASADDNGQAASKGGTCTLRSAVGGNDKDGDHHTVDSTVVDYSGSELFETVYRVTTDSGHALLNDSRSTAGWIDLTAVSGIPECVVDASVAVTEDELAPTTPQSVPRTLFITVVAQDGVVYGATCDNTTAPLTPSNIGTACAPGFTPIY